MFIPLCLTADADNQYEILGLLPVNIRYRAIHGPILLYPRLLTQFGEQKPPPLSLFLPPPHLSPSNLSALVLVSHLCFDYV